MNISGANSKSPANNFLVSGHNIGMGNLPGRNSMNMIPVHINQDSSMEIPIFTEEFLNHNKARELELRALRKTLAECEEQNALLQKHLERARAEVERTDQQMTQQKLKNEMLRQNLNKIRSVLAQSLASLPLPGSHKPPNIQTIDDYMKEVKAMQEANSRKFAPFLKRVKAILNKIDLEF